MNDSEQRELARNEEEAKRELQEALNILLDKTIGELTEENKEFLYARRSYLNREQRNLYKRVFAEVEKAHAEKLAKEAAGQPVKEVVENKYENQHPADVDQEDDIDTTDEDLDNVDEKEIG